MLKFFLTFFIKVTLLASHIEWDIGRYGFKKISNSPEIYLAENFLTDAECNHIIEKARPTLSRSTVVDRNSSKGVVDKNRTSLGSSLSDGGDQVIQNIRNRVETITMIPYRNGEGLQVLNYGVGAEYKPHYDYFDAKTEGGKSHLKRGGQRVATILLYLNTPEKGGETIFPNAPLHVRPVKGRALLFYDVTDQGKPDSKSLHGGAPVIAGEKWIANLWLREGEFH